jgi:hypothetical protein
MSTPTESSVAVQMARLLPSQVGSRVFSKADSSMVSRLSKIVVALVYVSSGLWARVGKCLHQPKAKHNPKTPLCASRELYGGEVDDGCYDIYHVRYAIGDSLHYCQ